MAVLTSSALNSVGIDFNRSYAEHLRSLQVELERRHREQPYMVERDYLPMGKFLAPMPPPPSVSGAHKRNKKVLLCRP